MPAFRLALSGAVSACALAASSASAQDLRIGFLNTTSGNIAVVGKHLENGWKLGLASEGWKRDGGKPEKRGVNVVLNRPDSLWEKCPADKHS